MNHASVAKSISAEVIFAQRVHFAFIVNVFLRKLVVAKRVRRGHVLAPTAVVIFIHHAPSDYATPLSTDPVSSPIVNFY